MKNNKYEKINKKYNFSGKVISVEKFFTKVIVNKINQYNVGQKVIIKKSKKIKTNLGKKITVTDIIAIGNIIRINKDILIIESNINNPIISLSAIASILADNDVRVNVEILN